MGVSSNKGGGGAGGGFTGLTGVNSPLSGAGTSGNALLIPAASPGVPGHMTASHVSRLTTAESDVDAAQADATAGLAAAAAAQADADSAGSAAAAAQSDADDAGSAAAAAQATANSKLAAVSVTAPVAGNGTPGSPINIPDAAGGQKGLMTTTQVATLGSALQTVAVTAPVAGNGTGGSPISVPDATTGQKGLMTTAQATQLVNLATGAGLGFRARTLARAMAKALFTTDEAIGAVWYEGGQGSSGASLEVSWGTITAAGGAVNMATTGQGAAVDYPRSITSGTTHYQRNSNGHLPSGTGKKWYTRVRVKLSGTVGMGAAAIIATGFSNNGAHSSNFIDVGVVAAISTTKFAARLSANSGGTVRDLTSTINLDTTNYHWLEVWCDGTNVFLSVDDETPVSGAYVNFTTPQKANVAYIADATTGTRTLTVDRGAWMSEQAV